MNFSNPRPVIATFSLFLAGALFAETIDPDIIEHTPPPVTNQSQPVVPTSFKTYATPRVQRAVRTPANGRVQALIINLGKTGRTALRARSELQRYGHHSVGPLIRALGSSNRRRAENAVRTLAGLRNPQTQERLVGALKSRSVKVRIHAAWALSMYKGLNRKALPGLMKALNDRNKTVRFHAVWALIELGRGARPALPQLRRLARDRDFYVKGSAKYAIREILK